MMGPPVDASTLMHGCEYKNAFKHFEFPRAELESVASTPLPIRYLRNDIQSPVTDSLRHLKFGTHVASVTYETQITVPVSGVMAKALVGVRNGDNIEASVAIGATTCDTTQQYTVVTHRECKRKFGIIKKCHDVHVTVPRGFNPDELNRIHGALQVSAAKTMFDGVSAQTGVNSFFAEMTEGTYLAESKLLQDLYPDARYQLAAMRGVSKEDLQAAVREASKNEIVDSAVLEKVAALTQSAPSATILHAPNDNVVYVIQLTKLDDSSFSIRQRSFNANGKLPGGAFAFKTAEWTVERPGRPTETPALQLAQRFNFN